MTASASHCTAHSHHGSSRAWRLILARHRLDDDAARFLEGEVGDCALCWRDVALLATNVAADLLAECEPRPVAWAAFAIDQHMRAEELDRLEGWATG